MNIFQVLFSVGIHKKNMKDEEEEGIWCLRIKIASDATIWELKTKEQKSSSYCTKIMSKVSLLNFLMFFSK